MISMQMNNPDLPFDKLETSLRALSARMPDLPLTEVMLCRLMLHIGREMAAMLEQQIRPFGLTEAEFRVLTTCSLSPTASHIRAICARAPRRVRRTCRASAMRW